MTYPRTSLTLQGIEPRSLVLLACSLVIAPTELLWLLKSVNFTTTFATFSSKPPRSIQKIAIATTNSLTQIYNSMFWMVKIFYVSFKSDFLPQGENCLSPL